MNRTAMFVASAALLSVAVFVGCGKKGQSPDSRSGYDYYEGPTTVQVTPPAETPSGSATETPSGEQQQPGMGHHSTGMGQGRAAGGGMDMSSGSMHMGDGGMHQEPVQTADAGASNQPGTPGDVFEGTSPNQGDHDY